MKVRRYVYLDNMGSRESIMAFALFSWMRVHHDCGHLPSSINALRRDTGLHSDTIGKRLDHLCKRGLISVEKGRILLKSASSVHPDRNIAINIAMTDTVREIAVKLVAYYHDIINQRKQFAGRIMRHDSSFTSEDVKKDYRVARKYGWAGKQFHDDGVSYGYMAKRFGMARATVVSMIKKAIAMGILVKRNVSVCQYMGAVSSFLSRDEISNIGTFLSRRGYLYKVFSNKYYVTSKLCDYPTSPVDF